MSNIVSFKDPEIQRKAAVAAIPRCEVAMNLEGKKKVPDFVAYRKAKLLKQACVKVLSA